MNFIVAYLLLSPPQIPIRKYIGIKIASKNINKVIKSPLMNTPLIAKWRVSKDPINPLLSPCSLFIENSETKTNSELRNMSKADMPDSPMLKSKP